MNVLLTGATGLLGSYLLKTKPQEKQIYSERFNILDKDATYKAFDEAKPDIVIHCAGEGRVDFAEINCCSAGRTNLEGTEILLRASEYHRSDFVYISSNAVYNGASPPYSEGSPPDPINRYGFYKARSDQLVRRYDYGRTTIIRPILLYGWPGGGRDNMATRLIKNLQTPAVQDGAQLPIDCEIISQPTYAYDCAEAIWKIIAMQTTPQDEFNVAATERMTLFKFAGEVAKAFDLNAGPLVPVPTAEIKVPAKRPRDTTYGLDKIRSMGITLRNPAEGLAAMRAEQQGG